MVAQGDLAGALKSDDDNLAIRERLANPTPARSVTCTWSRTTLPAARQSYNDSLAIADRLAIARRYVEEKRQDCESS